MATKWDHLIKLWKYYSNIPSYYETLFTYCCCKRTPSTFSETNPRHKKSRSLQKYSSLFCLKFYPLKHCTFPSWKFLYFQSNLWNMHSNFNLPENNVNYGLKSTENRGILILTIFAYHKINVTWRRSPLWRQWYGHKICIILCTTLY